VTFPDLHTALPAVRALAQSDLAPANCRLLDAGEAALSGAANGDEHGRAVLVLGFESATGPVQARLADALELARAHGGRGTADSSSPGGGGASGAEGAVGAWRAAFLRMPYLRDGLARMGAVVETFETATTWDRLPGLIDAVRADVGAAARQITGHPATINCRLTHVYPDGAAPYFTVLAAGRPGDELAVWDELKAVAGDVLHRHRATITHHHAVGRDHRSGDDRQRPEPFALALKAAKNGLDPHGILNPGVLLDP
jgi:alkyldihydroxyacetonephosphate synthase